MDINLPRYIHIISINIHDSGIFDLSLGDIMYLGISQYQVDNRLWATGWAQRAIPGYQLPSIYRMSYKPPCGTGPIACTMLDIVGT